MHRETRNALDGLTGSGLIRVACFLFALSAPMYAADWSHWRGPNRDGTTDESSGWEQEAWPPKERWRANVGVGSSSPLVIQGRLYTMGWDGNADRVVCLDVVTGRELWRVSYACPRFGRFAVGDQSLYAGPTATPEFDEESGLLFTLSTDGDLNCWDTREEGRRVWWVNLYQRYHMPRRPAIGESGQRDYGYTTAPLICGDELLIEAGGDAGTIVALDKHTGTQRWASEARDLAGHTGAPAFMTVAGVPCLAALTTNGLLVIRLDPGREGRTVAEYPYQTDFANSIASPAVYGSDVVITSGYNHNTMTKLRVDLSGVTTCWEVPHILSKVCTPVFLNNRAYWSHVQVHCLDMADGALLWKGNSGGAAGSCIVTADERLIIWANRGDLLLVDTAEHSPSNFRLLAKVPQLAQSEAWSHVALADGRLFCKDRLGNIVCLSLHATD